MFVSLLLTLLLGLPLTVFGATATCTWTDTSSGNSQEDYFVLERGPGCSGPWADIAHPPQDTQTYVDTTVTPGTYCYRIKGENIAGSGGYSNTDSLTIPVGALPGVPGISCAYSNPATPSGLVLALSMNAGSGTVASDSSGNNNHGTLAGATWTTSGKYGAALSFDGGDWVTINDAPTLDLTTGMTLEAWVYPTVTPTTWSTVLMKQSPGEFVYVLYAGSPANRPNLYIDSGGHVGIAGSSALPLNVWSHVAGTFDGSMMRIYVNGVQVGSLARTGTIGTSSQPLALGRNLTYQEFFTGRMDEVRIYNRALSPAEIQTDRNTAITP